MDAQPRRSMGELKAGDLPDSPGVYALYRNGERQYVGKADCLRDRVWRNHSGRGAAMSNSAMRRNLAEHLYIATSADLKARRYHPTAAVVGAVRNWLDGCHIAWLQCASELAAATLEDELKAEYKPPLTKR